MGRLDRMLNRVETVLAVLAGVLLLFITFSICASIALRALNLQVPLWSVQFNEYSLLWMTFLGGAWLLRRKRHVSLDILTRRLNASNLRILNSLHAALGLLVCGCLTWICGVVVWDHFQRGVIDVRAVDVPKHWILAVVFFGFFILTLEFMCEMLREVRQVRGDR
ncbi:MAG: TRAP transporter small permease [Desulfobacterales bacterium]|nr:MAG: TRAP transporter small permease [Desulfobacterales bacterium]